MANTRRITHLRDGDRERLERLIRSRAVPQRVVERARIVLSSADGLSGKDICREVGVSPPTVLRWLNRYDEGGLRVIEHDRPRTGRPKRLDPDRVEAEIVRRTVETRPPPEVATRWSTRLLAADFGVSRTTVMRLWHAHGLRPHRIETSRLSDDPQVVEQS